MCRVAELARSVPGAATTLSHNRSFAEQPVLIGYMRVSKADGSQTLDLQRDALLAASGNRRVPQAQGKAQPHRPHDVGPSLVSPERRKKCMSGIKRLPGGERRKASQRNRPARATPSQVQIAWRAGDPVRWKDRTGLFRREVGDNEHAEIAIAERVYRVKLSELG